MTNRSMLHAIAAMATLAAAGCLDAAKADALKAAQSSSGEAVGQGHADSQNKSSAPEPTSPPIPDTPLGSAAKALVAAVNGDDPLAVGRFVEANYVLKPNGFAGAESSREEAATMIGKLRLQSGGLQPVNVRGEAGNADYLGVMFACRSRDAMVGIEFFGSASEPGKIRETALHVTKPPRSGPPPSFAGLTEAALRDKLDEVVRAAVENDGFSGTVLIARGDDILLHRGYGLADAEQGVANTPETLFNTASVGKMFTGVAVGQLLQAGQIRIDQKLIELLPDYPDKDAAAKITLEHLLTHTSGLGDPLLVPHDPQMRYDTPWRCIELFARKPLAFEPGSQHGYSNGNYAVLAAVVERVSGRFFGEYLREHVFRPAGMDAADLRLYSSLPQAKGYANAADDPLGIEPKQSKGPADPPSASITGFGGLQLNAADLHRFLAALRAGKLLDADSTELVTSGKVQVGPGGPMKYGYGFYDIDHGGHSVRGHSGGGGNMGYGAHAECIWQSGVVVVVLGNRDLEHVRPLSMTLLDGLRSL